MRLDLFLDLHWIRQEKLLQLLRDFSYKIYYVMILGIGCVKEDTFHNLISITNLKKHYSIPKIQCTRCLIHKCMECATGYILLHILQVIK